MRPVGGDSSQNLDSLLDTMANVVGILVVVMAVTQISVGQAMERISAFASEEITALRETSEALASEWHGTESEAAGTQRRLEALASDLQALRGQPAVATSATAASVARRERAVARLEEEIALRREGLAALRVSLEDFRGGPAVPVNELRLPDPRPAPYGTTRVDFFTRHGRVLPVDFEGLKERLFAELRREFRLGGRIDDVARHFVENDIGDESFRWRVYGRGGRTLAELHWRRTDLGERGARLAAPSSAYRRALSQLDPSRHYLVFTAWSDSFDAYLAARRIAEEQGFAAGWEAFDAREELAGILTGDTRDPNPIPID